MMEVLPDRTRIELTMARLNHISVEIDSNCGSTIQEETAFRMLEKVVRGWKEFYLSKTLDERHRDPRDQRRGVS